MNKTQIKRTLANSNINPVKINKVAENQFEIVESYFVRGAIYPMTREQWETSVMSALEPKGAKLVKTTQETLKTSGIRILTVKVTF